EPHLAHAAPPPRRGIQFIPTGNRCPPRHGSDPLSPRHQAIFTKPSMITDPVAVRQERFRHGFVPPGRGRRPTAGPAPPRTRPAAGTPRRTGAARRAAAAAPG